MSNTNTNTNSTKATKEEKNGMTVALLKKIIIKNGRPNYFKMGKTIGVKKIRILRDDKITIEWMEEGFVFNDVTNAFKIIKKYNRLENTIEREDLTD